MNDAVRKVSKQQVIMDLINTAGSNLLQAGVLMVDANPMSADLECYKKLKLLQTQITDVMREVSKVRGLG